LHPRSLDGPAGRGQNLPIGADEVRFERSAKAVLAVVDLHRNTNMLLREEFSSVVEGKPANVKPNVPSPLAAQAPCVVLINILPVPSAGGTACYSGAVRKAIPWPVKLTRSRAGADGAPDGVAATNHEPTSA